MSQGEGRENEHIPTPTSSVGNAVIVVGPLYFWSLGMDLNEEWGRGGKRDPPMGHQLGPPLGTTVYVSH